MKDCIQNIERLVETSFLLPLSVFLLTLLSCSDKEVEKPAPGFNANGITIDGAPAADKQNVSLTPVIRFAFTSALKASGLSAAVSFTDKDANAVPFNATLENNNYTIAVRPASPLKGFTVYTVSISNTLTSEQGGNM